jgi:ADP-ribosylglycohydrolase
MSYCYDFLQYINQMKICSKCYEIFGFWRRYNPKSVYYFSSRICNAPYQKCSLRCEDYNQKRDMPPKEINQEKWSGFDFNELVSLCYCCGQEVLKSGSRWSTWFCEDCKHKVIQLNAQVQRCVIPIGRHSMMNGIGLNGEASKDPKLVERFLTKANNMFANIEKLSSWYAQRLSDNFKVLGYDDDVSLNDYLRKVAVAVDKSGAFDQMCDFLFGIGESEPNQPAKENDRKISEDDNHIDNHDADKPAIKEKESEAENRSDHSVYIKAMELYKLGDIMGSVFEGGPVYYRRYRYDEIEGKCISGGFRTDESDIVDCFNNFVSDYRFRGELQLMLDWVVYHTKHRAYVKYGRTYREQFLIVGTLKGKDNLSLDRLFELSEDKNSYGNGCLALVYPVYHYAESLNLGMDGKLKLVINFCRLTHAHSYAISAVTLLCSVIDIAMKGGDIFDPEEHSDYSKYYSQELKDSLHDFLTRDINLEPEDFIKKYPNNIIALNTLFYALYSVKNAANMDEVVINVISFNGDADSVNAVAMMLWGIIDSQKIGKLLLNG